jgi:glucose-1-phosphate adenylyltransferase
MMATIFRPTSSWKRPPYWKDVEPSTPIAAHMDLLQHPSQLTLFNPHWPIRTVSYADPPASLSRERTKLFRRGSPPGGGKPCPRATVHFAVLSRNCIIHRSRAGRMHHRQNVVIGEGVNCGEPSWTHTTPFPETRDRL